MLNMCVESELDIVGNIKNVEYVRREWAWYRRKYLAGRVDGWMGGWMEAKAGLRIAYNNQKRTLQYELFQILVDVWNSE